MSFSLDISKFAEKAKLNGSLVARKFALLALQGVVERSPVRTGRFRASWQPGVGAADRSVEPLRTEVLGDGGRGPATGEELAKADAVFRRSNWGDTLFVSNSLPYAQALEDGSSKQTEHQPDGILGVTVDGLEAHLAQITAQVTRR